MKTTRKYALPVGLLALAVLRCAPAGDDDSATIAATVSMAGFETLRREAAPAPMQLPGGYFDLAAYPAFVQISASRIGQETATASWPASPEEFLAAAETAGELAVELALDVIAATDWRLDVVAFRFAEGRPLTFAPEEPTILDLAPGETVGQVVETKQVKTGKVSGAAGAQIAAVWLIDEATAVRLAEVVPHDGTYLLRDAPYGRNLAVVWLGQDGQPQAAGKTFQLSAALSSFQANLP
jgi:hypothetical protein